MLEEHVEIWTLDKVERPARKAARVHSVGKRILHAKSDAESPCWTITVAGKLLVRRWKLGIRDTIAIWRTASSAIWRERHES
jgi:hypothetical protein